MGITAAETDIRVAPSFGRRDPDIRGYFGVYGGRFVPETLVAPIEELQAAYFSARTDPLVEADPVLAEHPMAALLDRPAVELEPLLPDVLDEVHAIEERGLLDETLVVIMGEFGRTPKLGYVTSGEPVGEKLGPERRLRGEGEEAAADVAGWRYAQPAEPAR